MEKKGREKKNVIKSDDRDTSKARNIGNVGKSARHVVLGVEERSW